MKQTFSLLKYFIVLILVHFIPCFCVAQQTPAFEKPDSVKVYKEIEKFSKQGKFGSFVQRLLFKKFTSTSLKQKRKYKQLAEKSYKNYEGRIIRKINIVTLDPFGYLIQDTVIYPQGKLQNAGNSLHIKTQLSTIKNLLLIKENDTCDSLLIKESERLIRRQKYVRDVLFYPVKAGKDSMDILIRVLDNWSLVPTLTISSSKVVFGLTERNFLGTGHDFKSIFSYNDSVSNALETSYYIPSIGNSYINTTIHYRTDANNNTIKSLIVERPFYSPFTKWAGGFSVGQQLKSDTVYLGDTVQYYLTSKFISQDYWAAKAWQLFKGNSVEERSTNFILSARFLNIHYLQSPGEQYNFLNLFADENLYLTGFGISTRTYVQDKYIFNYGFTEDVPVGISYGIVTGYQQKNTERFYIGLNYSWGNYFNWGYFSSHFSYGTFLHSSKPEQGVLILGANYFTNLFEIGAWKLRQFIKPEITIGIKRNPTDYLTVNYENGIKGFNNAQLLGRHRIFLTLQTQAYSPWNILGFRFGPYLVYSMGMLSNKVFVFNHSRLYSEISLGVLIKNEFLVLNTFQFSIAFYPIIPGEGSNILKINSYRTSDFGFQDFDIEKPELLYYH